MIPSFNAFYAATLGSAPEPPAAPLVFSPEDCAAVIAENEAEINDQLQSLAGNTDQLAAEEALAREASDAGDEAKAKAILERMEHTKAVIKALNDSITRLGGHNANLRLGQICHSTFESNKRSEQILAGMSGNMQKSQVETVQNKIAHNVNNLHAMYDSIMGRQEHDDERLQQNFDRLRMERVVRRLRDEGQRPMRFAELWNLFEQRMQRIERSGRDE